MPRNTNSRRIGWLWLAQRTTTAIACALALAAQCQAAMVLKRGSSQPILGHLVRQDEHSVVIREELAGGQSRETVIPRGEIDELIITVDLQRLAGLDPSQLAAYREYAEELAEKRRDPEARDAARRLSAIAAARGDASLRKSALLGLISLARSPDEERKFRAAAFLHDPQHDAAVLAQPNAPATPAMIEPPPSELLAAVRLIRQGRGSEAKALLDLPQVRRAATRLAEIIEPAELAAAASVGALSDQQLAQLLRVELELEGTGRPASQPDRQVSWSESIKRGSLAPVPLLELERLTEFDPAECVFRDGKWQRP
jgi:hypothetical protein